MASDPVYLPTTKADYAYRQLRDRIVNQDLEPGSRLMLRPLAAELGLSVMPVRDALRMLEGDGLVTLESHRGARVTEISRESVFDTIGARLWLEVLAAREAALNPDAIDRAIVKKAMGDLDAAAKKGDGRRATRANRQLHEALEAPASPIVRELITDQWDSLWVLRRNAALYVRRPQRIKAAQTEHRALVKAIYAGDPDLAGRAMQAHRDATLTAWREVLTESD
jgi:DNA-binding GntR family transcriptional regulator